MNDNTYPNYTATNGTYFKLMNGLIATCDVSESNCYTLGAVSGNAFIGGLIGNAYQAGILSNCYAAPITITSTSSKTGVCIGGSDNKFATTIITNCYYSSALGINGIGEGTPSGNTAKTDAQLKAALQKTQLRQVL